MKIRSDFVTNSSSSSFIIGTKDDNITKEIVFQMLKSFYQEMQEQWDSLAKVADELGIVIVDLDGYRQYRVKSNQKGVKFRNYDKETCKIAENIENKFGINYFDCLPLNEVSPTKFNSYQEYEDYWLKTIKENEDTGTYIFAPFTIVDYMADAFYYPIHYGGSEALKKIKTPAINDADDLYGWYIGCTQGICDEDEECEEKCSYCIYNKDDDNCKSLQNKINKGEITKENAIVSVLGRVCIHSESGRIPDYVLNKLYNISRVACNHMG